jgi:hypothetical protein
MASVYDKIFALIVQKSRVYPPLFHCNHFHKESTLLFMNTALYPRKESTLFFESTREKVDWVGTMEIFSPNIFEYWLSSL